MKRYITGPGAASRPLDISKTNPGYKMKKTPENSEDSNIIHSVLAGDVNAFEPLLLKYQGYVLAILKRHLPPEQVEETAQEVFIRAYQSLPSFKQKSSFKSWLASVAVRTCYDFWRKYYRNRETPLGTLSEEQQVWIEKVSAEHSNQDFEALGRRREAREILSWALDKLSPEDRMVLELVYLEERSVKEAAELLGWSSANVKVRSFRARNKLKKMLKKVMEE